MGGLLIISSKPEKNENILVFVVLIRKAYEKKSYFVDFNLDKFWHNLK